jgi:hypothetical protein
MVPTVFPQYFRLSFPFPTGSSEVAPKNTWVMLIPVSVSIYGLPKYQFNLPRSETTVPFRASILVSRREVELPNIYTPCISKTLDTHIKE